MYVAINMLCKPLLVMRNIQIMLFSTFYLNILYTRLVYTVKISDRQI